jgi:hypothetical protein
MKNNRIRLPKKAEGSTCCIACPQIESLSYCDKLIKAIELMDAALYLLGRADAEHEVDALHKYVLRVCTQLEQGEDVVRDAIDQWAYGFDSNDFFIY